MTSSSAHGVKRPSPPTPSQLHDKRCQDAPQIITFKALVDQVLAARTARQYDQHALDLTATLVSHWNPEYYSMWNYRKEILQSIIRSAKTPGIESSKERHLGLSTLLEQELSLTQSCLTRHPKSYWIWSHRLWVLFSAGFPAPPLERELQLINHMLSLDARNFHGWDYRRTFLARLRALPQYADLAARHDPPAEIRYADSKIKENFSNYSAWHYKSQLMGMLPLDAREERIQQDIQRVRNAIYTEPGDQSAWLYQRCLLAPPHQKYTGEGIPIPLGTVARARLEEELGVVLELLEMEPDSKWCLSNALWIQQALNDRNGVDMELVKRLVDVDPFRKGYYRDIYHSV